MSYSEWLELFEQFKNTSTNKDLLEKLSKEPDNPSIHDKIIVRYADLISYRLELSVNKIINDLDNIYSDQNYMDFALVTFKKEINYLITMLNIPLLNDVEKANLKVQVKNKVDQIFDIMNKKALEIDYTGVLSMMIKSNGINWS